MDLPSLKASAAAAAKKTLALGACNTPPAPDDLTDSEKEEWGRLFAVALREIEIELNGIPIAIDKLYIGKVDHIKSSWVIQNIGQGKQVAHPASDFDSLPAVNDKLEITRRNGQISCIINKTAQQQGQSKGR